VKRQAQRVIEQGQTDIDPSLLHVRPDEEPDTLNVLHQIDRQVYMYGGCTFCGHETHVHTACPNKPKRRG
jgi:hypothetical protein